MFFKTIDIFGLSIYQMSLLFIVWSFIGWAVEVCAHTLKMGEYSNRGFLSMPICPIYGFGVLIITIILRPFMYSAFLVFLLSMIICTAFELFVGVLMKVLFHNMWWDYSDEHFNFKGYICLKTSIWWGIGGLVSIKFVEPFIESVIKMLPYIAGVIFLCVMTVLITIDLINSVAAVNRMNIRLREISEISGKLYDAAQVIGKTLGDTALEVSDKKAEVAADFYTGKADAIENLQEFREKATAEFAQKKDRTEEMLRARLDAMLAFSDRRVIRLIKAYPGLHSDNYHDALLRIKERISQKVQKANKSEKN